MAATLLVTDSAGEDISGALALAAPFKGLSEAILKAVAAAAEARRYAAGETAFAPGQFDASWFLLVISGRLRVSSGDPQTGAVFIEEIAEGEFFGLVEAVLGEERACPETLTIEAEGDVEAAAFDAAEFRALVAQRPSLARNLMLYFAGTLARIRARREDGSSLRRVLSALMAYIERDAVSGEWRVPRMPKHRELAEKAGADEADAARAVARLIQEGVARRDYPGLVIEDMALFNQMAS